MFCKVERAFSCSRVNDRFLRICFPKSRFVILDFKKSKWRDPVPTLASAPPISWLSLREADRPGPPNRLVPSGQTRDWPPSLKAYTSNLQIPTRHGVHVPADTAARCTPYSAVSASDTSTV